MFKRIIFILTCLCITNSALAAKANQENAEKLKTTLQKYLDEQENIYTNTTGLELLKTGQIRVTPIDEYYSVIFPYYKIQVNLESAFFEVENGEGEQLFEKLLLDIGSVRANVTEGDQAGQWKMAFAAPENMQVFLGEEPVATITISEQKSAGIFDENINYFIDYQGLAEDIKVNVTTPELPMQVSIDQLITKFEMPKTGKPDHFDLAGFINLSDLELKAKPTEKEKGKIDLNLGSLRLDASMEDFNLTELLASQQKMQEIQRSIISAAKESETNNENLAAEQKKKIAETISELPMVVLNHYKTLGENTQISYLLKDFELEIEAQDKADDVQISMDELRLGTGFGGFTENAVFFGTKFGFSGLEIDNMEDEDEEYLPQNGNLDITFEDIPLNQIIEIAQNATQAFKADPQNSGTIFMMSAMKLPMILSQAGTKLKVEDTFIKADAYEASLQGSVLSDINAVMSMVANFTMKLRGLDDIIENMQKKQAELSPEETIAQADTLQKLQMMQMFGEKTGDIYTYDFKLTPDGKTVLNGKDMNGMPVQ